MVQGAIAPFPGRERANCLLQKHLTGSIVLTQEGFAAKVAQCEHHLRSYRACRGSDAVPASVLELGTGWFPIVPVGLALAGAERVITIDVTSLLDVPRTRRVLELYASALQSGGLTGLGRKLRPERVDALIRAARTGQARDPRALLGPLGVDVRIGDVRSSGLPAGSIDLFVSNNTLEHIAPRVLAQITSEFRRLAAPGAVMDQFVDMSDHYAHFDAAISEFNYMRYSDRMWRVFNNRLQWQNRLRASDYRRIIEQAGFDLVSEERAQGSIEELRRLELAPRFRGYADDDLLVLRCWFTGVAGGSRASAGKGAAELGA